jgi:hypothetical protein
MANLKTWCIANGKVVNGHNLHLLQADSTKLVIGIEAVAKIIPEHYTSNERIAHIMRRLGKLQAAEHIEQKLPRSKNIRSGDLGEILCASYVLEFTDFTKSINRLRWKDHREMAMRGEDIIAIQADFVSRKIKFMKGEVKSEKTISARTISKARESLSKDEERPSAHALSFLAARLYEMGDHDLSDLIDYVSLNRSIEIGLVSHMLFVFSGNDAHNVLHGDLNGYKGSVPQNSVGLCVATHQSFIQAVYEKVIADARER